MKSPVFITLLCLPVFLAGCANNNSYKKTFLSMGTTAEISIPLCGASLSAAKKACAAAEAEIARINKMLSVFDRTSAVSAINNDTEKKRCAVSRDMYFLIKKCREYFTLTDGAFDITAAPLVWAWGFGPEDSGITRGAPGAAGSDKIELSGDGTTIYFKDPRVKMDFGGIGPGYAVDMAAEALKRNGIKTAAVNIGGELYCLGGNYPKEYWSVGIKDPRHRDSAIAILNVRDKAVATSGDYENFRISGGKKRTHIIDPRTAEPVENDLRSVTILADECAAADALATAVFVMGKEKGLELVERLPGVECFLVAEEPDGRFKVKMSKGMAGYLGK